MSVMSNENHLTAIIRINQKRYTDAYIDNPDGGPDIFIESRCDALEGDLVEVALHHHTRWRLKHEIIVTKWEEWCHYLMPIIDKIEAVEESSDNLCSKESNQTKVKLPSNLPPGILKLKAEHIIHLPFSSRVVQKTGSVISIVKRNNLGIAGGYLRPHSKKLALFSPIDPRKPRMLIDICECPLDFASQSDRYKDVLFVARITDWSEKFSRGSLIKIVGDGNTIQSRIEALLLENQIFDEDFPDQVHRELEYLNQVDVRWLSQHIRGRRNLIDECVFTIDPKTARDLDDAVSIKQMSENLFEVGVHIADVSYFVKELSAVDYHARLRTTSVYLVDRVIPMLPRVLCEQVCSLNPGDVKLTFSVIWKLDKNGRIIDEWFGKTVIRSCVKLAYEQAQDLIDHPCDISWIQEGVNMPQLYNFSWEKISRSITLLNKIARNLRTKRFDTGALRIEQVKLKYELDPQTGYPTGFSFENRSDANFLIEEYMLLANMSVAKRIYDFSHELAFLRRHPPSSIQLLKDVQEFCDAKSCPLDISSSHAIQKSLNAITNPITSKVVSYLLLRAMKNAEYICTGAMPDDGVGFSHFALNVPLYTHFTSPIRRYADIIVHRQLALALGYEYISNEDVYSLLMMANECTKRKLSAKAVSDASQKLYFNLFVKIAGFCELLACVTRIYDNSFDVILVDYDRGGRVYLDRLKPHLKSHKFVSFTGIRKLELCWDQGEESVESDDKKRTKKKKKKSKLEKKKDGACRNTRINLESTKAFCPGEDIYINEPKGGQQLIEVFDLVRVIVTANDKDVTQLNIDLKIPDQLIIN